MLPSSTMATEHKIIMFQFHGILVSYIGKGSTSNMWTGFFR